MSNLFLDKIVDELIHQLEIFLSQHDDASQQVQKVREDLKSLKGSLGRSITLSALRELRNAEDMLLSSRRKQVADLLTSRLTSVGIRLKAGPPLKRISKKKVDRSAVPAPKTGALQLDPKIETNSRHDLSEESPNRLGRAE